MFNTKTHRTATILLVLAVMFAALAVGMAYKHANAAELPQDNPPPPNSDIEPLPNIEFSAHWIMTALFTILTVAIEYIPGTRELWADVKYKPLMLMIGAMLLEALLLAGHYLQFYALDIPTTPFDVVWEYFQVLFAALGGDFLVWNFLKSAQLIPRKVDAQAKQAQPRAQ